MNSDSRFPQISVQNEGNVLPEESVAIYNEIKAFLQNGVVYEEEEQAMEEEQMLNSNAIIFEYCF